MGKSRKLADSDILHGWNDKTRRFLFFRIENEPAKFRSVSVFDETRILTIVVANNMRRYRKFNDGVSDVICIVVQRDR